MTDSENKLKLDINSLSEQFFAGLAVRTPDGKFIFKHRKAVFADAFKQNLKVFVVVILTIAIALLMYEYSN
jgi:hypothetical protein